MGKGGIVRDPEAHQLAIDRVAECVRSLGWQVVETIPSPITGMEGNQEFLLYARRAGNLEMRAPGYLHVSCRAHDPLH